MHSVTNVRDILNNTDVITAIVKLNLIVIWVSQDNLLFLIFFFKKKYVCNIILL